MPFPRPCVLLTTQPIITFQLLEASGPAAGKGASDDSFWSRMHGAGISPFHSLLAHLLFVSHQKHTFESFHLMWFSTQSWYPHRPLWHKRAASLLSCLCLRRTGPAGKEVSVKVMTCKYVPWWCRKLLRKALFTVISPPQQHLQQMLALFPWGSALKKTLQQGCCSLHFQEHDVRKA